MIVDSKQQNIPSELDCDVCIVGAGPAGITLALELRNSGLDILVAESGGRTPQAADQQWNEGEVEGLPYTGLTDGRVRALGGASKRWFGQCIRFDGIDFEQRPWVPHSGWPIQFSDLIPWYERAEAFFKLTGERYDERVYSYFGLEAPPWNRELLETHFTVYSPELDLGRIHEATLRRAERVRLLLHATCTEVTTTDDSGQQASGIRLRTGKGTASRVKAKVVVLCAGGLENARILLLSRGALGAGLGNAHDLVGRFLQDHPNALTATIKTENVERLIALFSVLHRKHLRYFPKFPLTAKRQHRMRTLNCTSHLVFEQEEDSGIAAAKNIARALRRRELPPDLAGNLRAIGTHLPEAMAAAKSFLLDRTTPQGTPSSIRLQCHTEQAPDPESRVTLSAERDALGLQKLRVNWRLNESERRAMCELTDAVGVEMLRLGLGEVVPDPWLAEEGSVWKLGVGDAYHHVGTTRMAAHSSEGVVDRSCKVFDVAGLYVAGTSTFPTSGYANTTLTIVALAMRLASHLTQQLA